MGKVTSVVTDDLKHCYECGTSNNIEIHHCLHGYANRKWADKYHLVVALCHRCHMHLHENPQMDRQYQMKGQQAFEKAYPNLNFREIFGKNLL